jgi:hypothetical protein
VAQDATTLSTVLASFPASGASAQSPKHREGENDPSACRVNSFLPQDN